MTDKRFTEIISIQKVIDNKTGKEYDCLIDEDLLKLLNELHEENERLKFENNGLKCALALNEVDYVIVDGKKIDIPAYYEFEQRYDTVIRRREYDGYD